MPCSLHSSLSLWVKGKLGKRRYGLYDISQWEHVLVEISINTGFILDCLCNYLKLNACCRSRAFGSSAFLASKSWGSFTIWNGQMPSLGFNLNGTQALGSVVPIWFWSWCQLCVQFYRLLSCCCLLCAICKCCRVTYAPVKFALKPLFDLQFNTLS